MKEPSLSSYLFVELQPGCVTFAVNILQTKEPNFTQADRFDNLIEQLLSSGRRLDSELQLRIHRRYSDINLKPKPKSINKTKKIIYTTSSQFELFSRYFLFFISELACLSVGLSADQITDTK